MADAMIVATAPQKPSLLPLTPFQVSTVLVRMSQMCKNPEIRKGQALFNSLYELHPKIADEIRGTDLDPFNNDDRILALILKLNGETMM